MNIFRSVLFIFLVGCMPNTWACDGCKMVFALDLQDQEDQVVQSSLEQIQQLFESGYKSIKEGYNLAQKLQKVRSKPTVKLVALNSVLKEARNSFRGLKLTVRQLTAPHQEEEDISLDSLSRSESNSGDDNQCYVLPSTKAATFEEEEEGMSYGIDEIEELLYVSVGAYISRNDGNDKADAEIIIRDMVERLTKVDGYEKDQIIEQIQDLVSYDTTKALYNDLIKIIEAS